jgi:1-deoxy-D-xylulose-5-phosphate reductoisomerase
LTHARGAAKVVVIGATGSVGGSVLDICARFPERFDILGLAARSRSGELLKLSERFGARYACLAAPSSDDIKLFASRGIELRSGTEGLESIAELPFADHIVFASSGTDAITALQRALRSDKDVSLANKESIVTAGPWVMPLVTRPDQLRPLDSEHSAIWQCLREESREGIDRILLTASGGPFRDWTLEEMQGITPDDALKHPVWNMGAKVTIDSANLMNKGIECIEAMQLFGMPHDRVGALIHPRSQIHGIVSFADGTMKFLFYRPDMRVPAAAALAWPERLPIREFEELSPPDVEEWSLEFFAIDETRFPCFRLAIEAGRLGGAYPPLLIGADEYAVTSFLNGRIPFLAISHIIERVFEKYSGPGPSTLEDAIELIAMGERMASEVCTV